MKDGCFCLSAVEPREINDRKNHESRKNVIISNYVSESDTAESCFGVHMFTLLPWLMDGMVRRSSYKLYGVLQTRTRPIY